MKKIILGLLALICLILVIGGIWLKNSNNFKREGTFDITVNEHPIEIIRDGHGIAYVMAQSKADVFRGQGFVNAQDRLFQIELYRALIKGKGAETLGTVMVDSDIKMRVLDIHGNAERHYKYLDDANKNVLQWFCEGFNAYLEVGADEFPLELGLLNMTPAPLTPIEIVSVTHFIGLFHSQNMDDEILSLNLASKMADASELLPLSVNLDRTKPLDFRLDSLPDMESELLKEVAFLSMPHPPVAYPEFGSNNWAISGERSTSGKPILANDPHVDARVLPGTFYPVGLICPDFKAVGIATPGTPGLISGRTEYVSFGVTNAYGDSQDLFLEHIEGDSYRQDSILKPLTIRKEVIKIKDTSDLELTIRSTERGPVISDFPIFNIRTQDDVSLRWTTAETRSSSIGFHELLEAKNASEFRETLYGMDNMFFNFVFADVHGSIAHQATGLVPIRSDKNGDIPKDAASGANWTGFIPKNELPNMINPKRGWVGTANHDTRPDDYPYFYSNHFSPNYRQERLKEVFDGDAKLAAMDLWNLIFDTQNKQAEKLNPMFIEALKRDDRTLELSGLLENWNHQDAVEEVGAAVYTVLYNELLYLMLNDELPDALEDQFWENLYYWNQRVDSMLLAQHRFIDDKNTPELETLEDLIVAAGVRTIGILTEKFGSGTDNWTWGNLHTVYFFNPIRKSGIGNELLGGELLPKDGSNQTLNRGGFNKNPEHEYETSWFSSFRMVADMSDTEKIMGVVSGGSAARSFHPYFKSQLKQWKAGEWIPYWFSEEKIREHQAYQLILE